MTDLKLREMEVPGTIFLGIKAPDTEFNEAVHSSFREMAEVECKNDYTLALGKLLEYYQADAKLEAFWFALQKVEERVAEIEKSLENAAESVEEDDGGLF